MTTEGPGPAITPRTRGIVTISPNNPSGAVFPPAVLEAINQLCATRGLLHISDEAYALFSHGGAAVWSPGSASGSRQSELNCTSVRRRKRSRQRPHRVLTRARIARGSSSSSTCSRLLFCNLTTKICFNCSIRC